jgi:predicted MFS family arabinose efflux permease
MSLGLLLTAVGAACIPLAPGPGWVAVALLVTQQTVGDAGHTLQQVHDRTLRQTAVPAALLARADAGIRSVGHIGMVAGALVGGAMGTLFDARTVLTLAAACVAAAALVAARHLAEPRPGTGSPAR